MVHFGMSRREMECPADRFSNERDAPWQRRRKLHVMLPGMKHRMLVSRYPVIGHTMVRPMRFGSLMTASSGTSIH